jgi:uncharacterized membrane protein YidH (DUF202 family)
MAEATMNTINAPDSRVNVLIRIVGVLFLGLGIIMTYLTYEQVIAAVLVPPLAPVLYLCSIMLMIVGFVALISKYRESGKPKA